MESRTKHNIKIQFRCCFQNIFCIRVTESQSGSDTNLNGFVDKHYKGRSVTQFNIIPNFIRIIFPYKFSNVFIQKLSPTQTVPFKIKRPKSLVLFQFAGTKFDPELTLVKTIPNFAFVSVKYFSRYFSCGYSVCVNFY